MACAFSISCIIEKRVRIILGVLLLCSAYRGHYPIILCTRHTVLCNTFIHRMYLQLLGVTALLKPSVFISATTSISIRLKEGRYVPLCY